MKVADGFISVRIRLNASKVVDNKEELLEAASKRRFSLYQKWLFDVKKSGVIDKTADAVEVPQKSSVSLLHDYEHEAFKDLPEQEINHFNLFKEVFRYFNMAFNALVFGTENRRHLPAKPDEVAAMKMRLVQVNQLIMISLLAVIFALLLFGK